MNAPLRDPRDGSAGPGHPSADDLAVIARIAEDEAGIVLPPAKASMIQSRLAPRLRRLGHRAWRDYLSFVGSAAGAGERREMISALTTNVSAFFRERHHFDLLRESILPVLAESARNGGRVRIWSAGCANGQEAYSIAMTVADALPDAASRDLRILATDIDPVVVAAARQGAYPEDGLASIPAGFARRYTEASPQGFRIAAPIRALVRFEELNLHGAWPMRGTFDAIFCRNVMIYFSAARQAALWNRFAAALRPGGWLLVGHAERRPAGAAAGLRSAGITAYTRAEAAA